jgi:selenide,water dikinase
MQLVLVGGGHSHLFVLEAFARQPQPGARLTLVTPTPLGTYSGMVPGVLGGAYPLRAAQIDLARLAARAGATLLNAAVTGIEPGARRLRLDAGTPLAFDLASFDIGSRPLPLDATPDAPLLALRPLDAAVAALDAARPGMRVVVVGAGAAGVEVAFALAARGAAVTCCDRAALPAIGLSAAAARRVRAGFTAAGIAWRGATEVESVRADGVHLRDQPRLPAELVINATGAGAAGLFAAAALPVDARGCLLIGDDLRAVGHLQLFGAGDCATLASAPELSKSGVQAVRQGPLLAANLRAAMRGTPLRDFVPKRRHLALLNTADGRAILSYPPFACHNRAAWWLKDRIDRRFVARFDR